MSEICWAHKKWNKIASDIKLVFHSSTAIEIWVLCSHWNVLRILSNLKIFKEELTSRNYLFRSLSSLSSLFTSAFNLYIKFSNIWWPNSSNHTVAPHAFCSRNSQTNERTRNAITMHHVINKCVKCNKLLVRPVQDRILRSRV